MIIDNADNARAWLLAWGGKPRRGILLECLRGIRTARAITSAARYSDETRAGLDGAYYVLARALCSCAMPCVGECGSVGAR